MAVGSPTLMKNLANDCERCSRYGETNRNRFCARLYEGSRIEKHSGHRVDVVKNNDLMIARNVAFPHTIHQKQVPYESVFHVLAQRIPRF